MLSTADAQAVAAEFRPRFSNPEDYATSVARYLDRVAVPVRSADGLTRWLLEDLDQHGVRAALLTPGVARPELVSQQLPDLVDDCFTCRGKRWVCRDLPPGHTEFGKAIVCPSCGGRPTLAAITPPAVEPVNRCSKCGAVESDWALEQCRHPQWHEPNWRSGQYPHHEPVPGWTTPGDQLAKDRH